MLAAALQPVTMRVKTIPGSQEGSTMTALDDDKPTPRGELTLQIIPLPSDTNANGDVFAGWLVKQMDLAAATMAGRISQGRNATVAMDRMEFLGTLFLLIVGGNDTTRNSISGGVVALNDNPDQYQKLRDNPGLIPSMVSEIIRYQTPLSGMVKKESLSIWRSNLLQSQE